MHCSATVYSKRPSRCETEAVKPARLGDNRIVEAEASSVPELSRFFGIVIRMFVEAGAPHQRPHVHAYYHDEAAVFALDTLECLGGSLASATTAPRRSLGGDSPRGTAEGLGSLAIGPASRQDRATQVSHDPRHPSRHAV